mgnify:FL=1|tara:strand:+ start:3345 stop:3578 length:234 start_codon:yes stop_codon:yes gene_type:complete
MAKVNLSKEEVEEVLSALANVITIKHRYRDIHLDVDIEMIREVLRKLENPFMNKENKIIRGLEDKQPRVGNCECCDD